MNYGGAFDQKKNQLFFFEGDQTNIGEKSLLRIHLVCKCLA